MESERMTLIGEKRCSEIEGIRGIRREWGLK